MFEKYMVDPADIQNVVKDGVVIGVSVKTKISYYRGVFLSLVEMVRVRIDGQLFDEKDITFALRGHTYTMDEMATMSTLRWEFGEKAEIFVPLAGGLTMGTHKVETTIGVRVSYEGGLRPFTNVCWVSPITPLKMMV